MTQIPTDSTDGSFLGGKLQFAAIGVLLYFAASIISYVLSGTELAVPAAWPQLGVIFAFLDRAKTNQWWVLAVIFGAVSVLFGLAVEDELPVRALLTAGELGSCAIGVWVYRRIGGNGDPLISLRSFGAFLSAAIITAALAAGAAFFANIAAHQDLAGALANLLTAFFSLLLAAPFCASLLHYQPEWFKRGATENAVLLLSLLVVVAFIYVTKDSSFRLQLSSRLILVLLLLYASVRSNSLVLTGMLLATGLTEIYVTLKGGGLADAAAVEIVERVRWVAALLTTRSLAFLTLGSCSNLARNIALDRDIQAHRLRSVIDTATDGIITIDERGIIETFSKSAELQFGYAASELIGRNVSTLMPEHYRNHHDGYLEKYVETGEKHIIGKGRIVEGRRKDGTLFPMELSVGEAKVGKRRIFTGFIRDITLRRDTERRLHETQEELFHVSRVSAMGELASALAHELNQPLTAIRNYAQAGKLHLQRDGDHAKVTGMLEKMDVQAGRAGEIIKKLRSFVTVKHVDTVLEDVRDIVRDACALALIGAKENGVRVSIELDQSVPRIAVDRIQVQQVLVNLIRNAVEAMQDSARRELTIATMQSDGHLQILVSDTGPGIDAQAEANLFKPFVTTKKDGMGIGLSISRTIAEAHGGNLQYSANGDGGSTFILKLPLLNGKEPAP